MAAGLLLAGAKALAQDFTPPTIVAVDPPAGLATNVTQIAVMFSEPVTNLLAEDLQANGIPAYAVTFTNGAYVFHFDPVNYGVVRLTWDPGHGITDLATPPNRFNENAAGSTWQYDYVDQAPPVMAAITPPPDATVRKLTQIEIAFSEPVAGVQAADLLVNGVPATSLEVLGPGRFRFELVQPATGAVQVAWQSAHGIKDFATTPNDFAGGSWNYTLDPGFGLATVRINEILAGNENTTTGLKDEDGELGDWIELYNYGSTAVNLGGYSLTDDAKDPGRWVFPSLSLGPGQYLIVFASGKDRKSALKPHTNFRLGLNGNYLGLYNTEFPREVVSEIQPKYPEQRNDYSYGLDSALAWKYFAAPTPGMANGDSPISRVVPKPHFNVARGLFSAPFQLILTPPLPGATIRYTADGSEPTATSAVYTAALTISNTTTLRAVAYYPNQLPSRVESHTYIFPDKVLRQPNNPPGYPVGSTVWGGYPADYEMDPEIVTNTLYSAEMKAALKALPAVSITMKIDDLFGATNGIYTHTEPPAAQRYLWERPCSVEMILTNGESAFQIDCGVRMQGNASRTPQKTPKHPFRLMFKGKYGAGSLDYPVYPDSPVASFDTLVLRADFNNSWLHWDANQRLRGTRIRDAWVKETARDMGMLSGHSRYFHLYLNGLYWGVYDFGERIDAAFAAAYLGGQKEDYDAIASKPTEAIDGDLTAYNAMLAAAAQPMNVLANYDALAAQLDMTHFIDYHLLNFFGANQDWGTDGNWNAVRRRAPGGKFKYVTWDGEQLVVNNNDNRLTSTDLPSGLHPKLIASPEYKLDFADRVQKHLFNGGALTPEANRRRWQVYTQALDLAILAESARWGDYRRDVHQYSSSPYYLYTRNDHWRPEMNRMLNDYFVNRPAIFLDFLRTAGLYPANNPPSFSQHGGRVARGYSLTLTNNASGGTIYYTTNGKDPRVRGTGAVEPTAVAYTGPITLNASAVVKARHLSGTSWSALLEAPFAVEEIGIPLRITEIMYNPLGGDAYEFIEIQNAGSTPVDVSYFALSGVDYTFPIGRTLAPGEVMLLASSLSTNSFAARYPGVKVDGYFNGSLANGGERLAIVDRRQALEGNICAVNYKDSGGWPKAADGSGYSLEIIDPLGDPDAPANWRASTALYGTPGVVSPAPALGPVFLNEIMADNLTTLTNAGTLPDWIELRNSGPQSVSLAGWSLTDDGNARKFVFPAETSLEAGGYLVVWCDTNSALPGLHTGFALSRQGDSLFLFDAATNRVDAVSFGLQISDRSIGRINGRWQLNLPTPNAANQAAPMAPASSLVINEWLANAAPGADDWIELYNSSTTLPVCLEGLYLSHSNTTHRLSALSYLPPGGHVQLHADENDGALHLNFKLVADGGTIVLYDASGAEVNRVTYGQQLEGISQGRLPDGSANIVSFPISATPGSTNYLVAYTGPVLNEIMAVNQATLTNSQGRTPDWVEIYNPSASAVDLSGMRLSDDRGNPAKWVFPAGTTITGNGYLVVWCDGTTAPTTNAGALLNTGFSLDSEGEEIWLFNAAGQAVDSVVFGFQVPDLTLGRSGGQWRLLAAPTPGAANAVPATLGSATALRINEWMANPASGDDWLELYNGSSLPVELSGLVLADSPAWVWNNQYPIAPLSFIGAGRIVTFIASGQVSNGRNHLPFALANEGEAIQLSDAAGTVLDVVYFGVQSAGVSQGRLPDGATNIVAFPYSATPGHANYLPLANVVINELLTHTDPPFEDAIELFNPSAADVNLGGWYLSDDEYQLKKYRITDGTMLAAGQFKVFYEYQFNSGAPGSFALSSAYGAEVWLSQADASGNLTGYRTKAAIGPLANGVSAGRFTTGVGTEYVPLRERTFGNDDPDNVAQFRAGTGRTNAYPLVGPVVITEIMFEPPLLSTNDNLAALEYIELHNLAETTVPLYDVAHPTNTWRLRTAVEFTFPTGVVMAAKSHLLVVAFDPIQDAAAKAAFLARYGLSPSTPLFGPWQGKLDNASETVELLRPDNPQGPGPDEGYVPYLLVEAVNYRSSAPWPDGANGSGASLQRFWPARYGNDPLNWRALAPTPASANVSGFGVADTDGDGLPDLWEDLYSLDRNNPTDALLDSDHDGFSNYDEFLLGTDPRNAGSRLVAPALAVSPRNVFVTPAQPAVFSAQAAETAPASFQWLVNNQPIAGANSPLFVLTATAVADTNLYRVVAANIVGAVTSAPVHLTVVTPPTPLAITNGTVTNLTVAAAGPGNYQYQWRLNGVDLPGATNTTFAITNAQTANEGIYTVLVTDGSDACVTPDAFVKVLYRVAYLQQPTPPGIIAGLGDSFQVSVTVTGSWPITYTWRRLSVPYQTMVLDANTATLTVTNLSAADAYYWDVITTNQVGNIGSPNSTRFFVTVVTNLPASRGVMPGSNVVLTAGIAGIQSPRTNQWRFNDVPLTNQTGTTLTITNFSAENVGRYTLEIRTATAAYVTPPAWLTFAVAPAVSQPRLAGNGDFSIALDGNLGVKYIVEASADLTNWTSVATIVVTNAQTQATLPTAGLPTRFFRIRAP